jgi:hypothetical protein
MPRRPQASVLPSTLRLAELEPLFARHPEKLMNIRIPEHTATAIDTLARELGCSKNDVVIALFNEGLDAFEQRRGEFVRRRK